MLLCYSMVIVIVAFAKILQGRGKGAALAISLA